MDAPLLLDKPDEIVGRPQLGGTAMFEGVVVQPPTYDLLLDEVQFGRSPRHGPRRQALGAVLSKSGDPATDATGSHAEEVSDFLDRVTLIDSLDGEPTTVLQNDR